MQDSNLKKHGGCDERRSIDYMMLDQALGLLGAVTVPIYYTTPVEEAELLLNRSGAKWFFVGDKRIMEAIEQSENGDRLKDAVRLVVFSAAQEITVSGAMRWEQFLTAGKKPAPVLAPDPEDLATIRYTSGTTGEPKGVMFNYHQLAWMGEVLTNLLSWKGRNREMRYLSFLPESHVVEGILASYAPYYMLAKVDFFFLNDFGALVDTLPKVRPTVFFSVPRFYEKLWDQFASNKMGQKYLSMQEGPGSRGTGNPGYSGKIRYCLSEIPLCRSCSLCGRTAAGYPAGSSDPDAVYQPAGGLYSFSLHGLPQLFL